MTDVNMGCCCLLLLLPLLCGGLVQKDPRYWLKVQEVLEVQKGLCAQVPCSVYHHELQLNSDFNVYWFKKGANVEYDLPVATNDEQRAVNKNTMGRFGLLRDPRTSNFSLIISDARKSDMGNYFFRLEQGKLKHSYQTSQLHIRVTAFTQKPTIHVPEPLVSGHTELLICSLPGACHKTNLSFSWAGEMINPNTEASSKLSLILGPQDHGKNLSCQVTLLRTREITEKTIRLNVSYAPQNLTAHVSFRAASEQRNQSVNLLCRADSNPPAELSWLPRLSGKVTITQNTATLELHLAAVPENAEFTCQARNYLGSQTISVRLSGVSPPQLLGPHCNWEAQTLNCTCSAHGWPVPALHWWLGSELLSGNYSNASIQLSSSAGEPWANSSLNLLQGFDVGLTLSCKASNMHGVQRYSILLLPGKPDLLSAAVPGALGVAGALALLSLCLCLIAITCMMRVRRKLVAAGPETVASEDPLMDSVPRGLKQKYCQDTPPDQAASASEDTKELHYASLSFHGRKPRESQHPAALGSTEYSEIRTRK